MHSGISEGTRTNTQTCAGVSEAHVQSCTSPPREFNCKLNESGGSEFVSQVSTGIDPAEQLDESRRREARVNGRITFRIASINVPKSSQPREQDKLFSKSNERVWAEVP